MSGPQQPDNLGGWWLSSCHSSVAGCIMPGVLSLIPSDCSRKYVIPKQNNNNKKTGVSLHVQQWDKTVQYEGMAAHIIEKHLCMNTKIYNV